MLLPRFDGSFRHFDHTVRRFYGSFRRFNGFIRRSIIHPSFRWPIPSLRHFLQ
ncbi:hypothetical protein [Lysinibacillus sp. JNUCC 51]|uniref:hypothetical protein n=1 Tax=Lysinibacillus sp. JNUCC-51 TaxID=2792479 RepID=UPI001937DF05|nr:hypothetical protein JNUCC51_00645 [Lysinibacillus sp. JNUCC-51]